MRKIYPTVIFFLILSACGIPKNFTNFTLTEDTGLGERINMNGVYISPFNCDSSFYTVYSFYSNGSMLSITTDTITEDVTSCFRPDGTATAQNSVLWGIYKLEGDTIKTQTIRKTGNGYVIFRDFLITADKSLTNLSDYVDSKYNNLAYLKNYPSFYKNECAYAAKFISLEERRDSLDCPFLNKTKFYSK